MGDSWGFPDESRAFPRLPEVPKRLPKLPGASHTSPEASRGFPDVSRGFPDVSRTFSLFVYTHNSRGFPHVSRSQGFPDVPRGGPPGFILKLLRNADCYSQWAKDQSLRCSGSLGRRCPVLPCTVLVFSSSPIGFSARCQGRTELSNIRCPVFRWCIPAS